MATEIEALEARVSRIEASLRAVESRLGAFETVERPVEPDVPSQAILDFPVIARCVLILGGAFLLRALTEIGLIPQRAGIAVGYLYGMLWVVLAQRAIRRDRRLAASYGAAIAATIVASLIWEATTRFKVLTPAIGSLLVAVTAFALLGIARRYESSPITWIAVALTGFTLTGVAVGTGDVIAPAIAAVAIALMARGMSPTLIVFSDVFAIVLVVMALAGRAPRAPAISVLVVFAAVAMARPQHVQTAVAVLIGLGGASLLAFDALTLSIVWSFMGLITARRWTWQAPIWIVAAVVAAFISSAVPVATVLALAALALMPADARHPRLVVLLVITFAVLANINALLVAGDGAALAVQRTIILVTTAVVLSLLGSRWHEALITSRIVLGFAAVKLLVEDFRIGRATTIAVALVAYGVALLVISNKGEPMKRTSALVMVMLFSVNVFAGEDGSKVYQSKCAMCHGATGAGDTPMGKKLAVKALGSPEVQKKRDDEITRIIVKGAGKMPGFGEKLNDEQVKQLVLVVRSFAKK